MTKKVLRIGLKVIYWGIFDLIIILNYFGILSTLGHIFIGMYIGTTIVQIIYYIYKRLKYKEMFNLYINVYNNLKTAHNIRYRYYFEGDEEKIKEYTKLVDDSAYAILYCSDVILKNKFGKKKEQELVEEIYNKTQVLITTIQPPV